MRRPKSEERALWRAAMHDVEPLDRRHVPAAVLPDSEVSISIAPPLPASTPARGKAQGRGLDRRSALRLKRGEMAIGARLDLHGMTQDEAHRALHRFITHSAGAKLRNLLVVTGKSGVLHSAVPRWLDEPDLHPLVLAHVRAQPKDGGSGALYVLLRRQR